MMIFIWLIIGIGVYSVLKNNGSADFNQRNKKNSVEVLKQRYVDGEIDDETYKKMIKIINN